MEPVQSPNLPLAVPPAPPHPSPAGWLLLVLLLCFLLGLLVSWIGVEHQGWLAQQDRTKAMRTAAMLASGQADDLGDLLADQRTVLIRLTGAGQGSIAYNELLHRGHLFCPNLPILPAGQTYRIVAIDSTPHTILDFTAIPGQSIYSFHLEPGIGAIRQFQLLDGSHRPLASGEVPVAAGK